MCSSNVATKGHCPCKHADLANQSFGRSAALLDIDGGNRLPHSTTARTGWRGIDLRAEPLHSSTYVRKCGGSSGQYQYGGKSVIWTMLRHATATARTRAHPTVAHARCGGPLKERTVLRFATAHQTFHPWVKIRYFFTRTIHPSPIILLSRRITADWKVR